MRFLKTLSSTEVHEGNPWEFTGLSRVPANCLTDKAARTVWSNDPNTEYNFYSMFDGVNENRRVSDKGGSEEGNPAAAMRGFAGDYDSKFTWVEIESAIGRMDIKPNWAERSLSGNWRLVWIFEAPILLASPNFTRFLLQSLHELLPINELASLDRGYMESSRYYTNGGDWRRIHDIPVGKARVTGWLVGVARKYSWKDNEPGVSIPMPAVIERFRELADKYPRFASWPGEFKVGAQGPSFWVEGSTSPTSAMVNANGMWTFADHAHKSRFTWSELLGADWVKAFEQNRIGNAVLDIYFDGHDYAVKTESGRWDIENKDSVINELVVNRGLTREVNKKKGQTFSEVEAALAYIRQNQRVKGIAPFAFFPKGKRLFNGDWYLNTHTKEVMKPADSPAVWGPEGQFPWLSKFLDNFFATADQLPTFLSWTAIHFRGCFYRSPVPGHTIFIAGPVCTGKTLLSRRILGTLFGGFSEAKDWLLGLDNFNSELFDYAILSVDDTSVGTNSAIYKKFCEMVKRFTANKEFRCNEKFRKAFVTECLARLIVCCNEDAESIVIPDMDMSMKDKVMLFRAKAPTEAFPEFEELGKILDRELPWFARFLLDYVIPDACKSSRPEDSRFGGILPYHDPLLMVTAAASSRTAGFGEALDAWMKEQFEKREPDSDVWSGTALDLYRAITLDPSMTEIMRQFSMNVIKANLSTLANGNRFKIRIDDSDPKRRIYHIDRSTHYPKGTQKDVSHIEKHDAKLLPGK